MKDSYINSLLGALMEAAKREIDENPNIPREFIKKEKHGHEKPWQIVRDLVSEIKPQLASNENFISGFSIAARYLFGTDYVRDLSIQQINQIQDFVYVNLMLMEYLAALNPKDDRGEPVKDHWKSNYTGVKKGRPVNPIKTKKEVRARHETTGI